MFVKEGTLSNLVQADFTSIGQVKQLLRKQAIHIGKLEHPVKPSHPPARIEKCKKCHSHDHSAMESQVHCYACDTVSSICSGMDAQMKQSVPTLFKAATRITQCILRSRRRDLKLPRRTRRTERKCSYELHTKNRNNYINIVNRLFL